MNLSLENHPEKYNLSLREGLFSAITLSGFVYTKRHVELSRQQGVLGHRLIAVLEAIPVLGGLAALLERVSVCAYNTFFKPPNPVHTPPPSAENNTTPLGKKPPEYPLDNAPIDFRPPVKADGVVDYGYRIKPKFLISGIIEEKLTQSNSSSSFCMFGILEVEGKLVALKTDSEYREYEPWPNQSLEDVLISCCQCSHNAGKGLNAILSHPAFDASRNQWIRRVLEEDEKGVRRLFQFKPSARDAFLLQLAQLFPEDFLIVAEEAIRKFSRERGYDSSDQLLMEAFEKGGGILDLQDKLQLEVITTWKLRENFYEDMALLSPEERDKVYETAYLHNNPFIHEPADEPVLATQYSVNFMWINENKIAQEQPFLLGAGDTLETQKKDFHEKFVTKISAWASANPGSAINIWIDGQMVTSEIIARSQKELEEALGPLMKDVSFKDIRDIEDVRSHPEVFLPSVPIYFRVDLLKAICADHILKEKKTQFYVHADLDVGSLQRDKLFDKKTVKFLDEYGFVMAQGGHLGFENSFQIFNGNHAQLMTSHRETIINFSINMARKYPEKIKPQQVYDTYPLMVRHFLLAEESYYFKKLFKTALNPEASEFKDLMITDNKVPAYGRNIDICCDGDEVQKIDLSTFAPKKHVIVPRSHFGAG